MQLEPIGRVRSPYLTKFGVPRQPGLVPSVQTQIELKPEFRTSDAVLGLRAGQWVHVLWCFSHNLRKKGSWAKTVRPPILGGTKRQGVFATRSSFRPNALALSCVKLSSVEPGVLTVVGGDMVDDTPIYDIYPYDVSVDCPVNARAGWSGEQAWPLLDDVRIRKDDLELVPEELRDGLLEVLIQDPRPAYTRHGQEDRLFWTAFGEWKIYFRVDNMIMDVERIEKMAEHERKVLIETGSLPE